MEDCARRPQFDSLSGLLQMSPMNANTNLPSIRFKKRSVNAECRAQFPGLVLLNT